MRAPLRSGPDLQQQKHNAQRVSTYQREKAAVSYSNPLVVMQRASILVLIYFILVARPPQSKVSSVLHQHTNAIKAERQASPYQSEKDLLTSRCLSLGYAPVLGPLS